MLSESGMIIHPLANPHSHHLPNYPLDPRQHFLSSSDFNSLQIGLSTSTLTPLWLIRNNPIQLIIWLSVQISEKYFTKYSICFLKVPPDFFFLCTVRWSQNPFHAKSINLSDRCCLLSSFLSPTPSFWTSQTCSLVLAVCNRLFLEICLSGLKYSR